MLYKTRVKKIEKLLDQILTVLQIDRTKSDWKETPARMARALVDDFDKDNRPDFKWKVFNAPDSEIVVLRHHTCRTRCPHHLERVLLDVSIGYIPEDLVLGASKLARLVDRFSFGAVLQENLGVSICKEIENHLNPKGVIILISGAHNCMQCRGVKTSGDMITLHTTGEFDEPTWQNIFFNIIRR